MADIQIVSRYPEAAAEECILSHRTEPGYKVDYQRGERGRKRVRERERESEVASGLNCRKDL